MLRLPSSTVRGPKAWGSTIGGSILPYSKGCALCGRRTEKEVKQFMWVRDVSKIRTQSHTDIQSEYKLERYHQNGNSYAAGWTAIMTLWQWLYSKCLKSIVLYSCSCIMDLTIGYKICEAEANQMVLISSKGGLTQSSSNRGSIIGFWWISKSKQVVRQSKQGKCHSCSSNVCRVSTSNLLQIYSLSNYQA